MIVETQTPIVYVYLYCDREYKRTEDAEKCGSLCAKLLRSPDICVLGLTSRTYNLLKIAGIDTIDEVLRKRDSELLRLKHFGQGSLYDLHHQLELFETKAKEMVSRGQY
ncbi:hypothetical protein SBF1_5380001 [Candidatus Desulfosporosinus infrequens]|uniref:RNA polymerase alpha subunit C-terminal domain-containing protein n=1 Tax=Candidatus Desulfosporosinus infrequens TaxID=2043169 RepID=A0A2U3LJ05_9FIRM|nr:hypothetical protein SBF1_5380001 [Candidatus Desulfosporosinus infrequens]